MVIEDNAEFTKLNMGKFVGLEDVLLSGRKLVVQFLTPEKNKGTCERMNG